MSALLHCVLVRPVMRLYLDHWRSVADLCGEEAEQALMAMAPPEYSMADSEADSGSSEGARFPRTFLIARTREPVHCADLDATLHMRAYMDVASVECMEDSSAPTAPRQLRVDWSTKKLSLRYLAAPGGCADYSDVEDEIPETIVVARACKPDEGRVLPSHVWSPPPWASSTA